MPVAVNRIEAPAAIRVDFAAIFVSLELSRSKWLITSLSLGAGEKMPKHVVSGSDVVGLLGYFAELDGACAGNTRRIRQITDGFWDKIYSGSFGKAQVGIVYSYT